MTPTYFHEHCMAPIEGVKPSPAVRRDPLTLSVHPSEWKAQRALDDLLGGRVAEGYYVCETERGWAVVRT